MIVDDGWCWDLFFGLLFGLFEGVVGDVVILLFVLYFE